MSELFGSGYIRCPPISGSDITISILRIETHFLSGEIHDDLHSFRSSNRSIWVKIYIGCRDISKSLGSRHVRCPPIGRLNVGIGIELVEYGSSSSGKIRHLEEFRTGNIAIRFVGGIGTDYPFSVQFRNIRTPFTLCIDISVRTAGSYC